MIHVDTGVKGRQASQEQGGEDEEQQNNDTMEE